MHLTRFTDQSLRCLMQLARFPGNTPTISELASQTGLTDDIVLKVVSRLMELGYVTTIRGRAGGVRLKRSPADIRLGALVTETETNMNLVSCFKMENTPCPLAPGCRLAGVLSEALAAFLTVLDRCTLQDMLGESVMRQAKADTRSTSLSSTA